MKIAVIGCGVMGSALARHFAKGHQVILSDQNQAQTQKLSQELGAKVENRLGEAVAQADAILLAVKPQNLSAVAKEIGVASKGKLLISILAGTSVAILKRTFPSTPILRIMPNLALTCGQGVTGMVDDRELAPETKKSGEALLDGLGLNVWMPENKLEALAALAASGIGFILLMLEAMMEGGIIMGFTSQEAKAFVLKTMEGAVALVKETGKHPAELKLNISSPAGMTIAGLKEMEDRGVRSGIINGLLAAHQRGLNLLKDSVE